VTKAIVDASRPPKKSASDQAAVEQGQGLTLAHFSAQPEPFLAQKHTLNIPLHPLAPLKYLVSTPFMHPPSHRISERV
jgi:hypothetical protein